MKFKSGVRIKKFINPAVMAILDAVQNASPNNYEPTITSANDSKHSENSLHYKDAAFDIRVKDYPGYSLRDFHLTRHHIDLWIKRIKVYLSNDYDIVFGDERHRDHIHIEFQPKKRI